MLFSSLTFLYAFLPITLILYFIFPNRKIKNIVLLCSSLIFYAWGEPKYVLLMIGITFISWIMGLLINYFKDKPKFKKLFLMLAIISIVGNLIFFKYINFIVENFNGIFKTKFNIIEIVLPLGISFYTFQILSYVIDLYKNNVKVQKNFFSLLLYVSLFPQLIAGPIVRYETVEDELNNRKINLEEIMKGFKRFIIGLSKKIIIANRMGQVADMIFSSNNTEFGTAIVWIGIISYTLQIYFDFSGYSDMAIGLGQVFGFHFLENFNYPYISKSITDFWRRWHISLSSWFRDYIYIPLGGNRVKKWNWIRNILIVWLLTGIWHGASWNYILWGLYFGLILLLEKLALKKYLEKLPSFLQWCYSIILIMIGWVIFRCESFEMMGIVFVNAFIYHKSNFISLINNNSELLVNVLFIIPGIFASFPIVKNMYNKFKNMKIFYLVCDIVLLILFGIDIVMLTSATYNPFIYFRF